VTCVVRFVFDPCATGQGLTFLTSRSDCSFAQQDKGGFSMIRKWTLVLVGCWLACAAPVRAQTLNQEMAGLAEKLSKALISQGFKSVAAIDFTDLQGQPTELGRFLAERLAIEIVSSGGVSMVDRANIKSILAEHKLTEEGLVNPANAKKLGEFAGVDAILIGNVTALEGVELMVKAISTDSAKIVAAGRITFTKTSDIQQLLNKGISGSSTNRSAPMATGSGGTSYQDVNAIATKDIGSLRVVLRSALLVKTPSGGLGVRCVFDLLSMETQRDLYVAMNSSVDRGRRLESALRSGLLDDSGGQWTLRSPDVNGLSAVGAGMYIESWGGGASSYSPTDIAMLLSRRYDLKSDAVGDIVFVFGQTTRIEPGKSITASMTFVNTARAAQQPSVIQLAMEIVVGLAPTQATRTYQLHNLVFDRISLKPASVDINKSPYSLSSPDAMDKASVPGRAVAGSPNTPRRRSPNEDGRTVERDRD